jgi:hypothetical protein
MGMMNGTQSGLEENNQKQLIVTKENCTQNYFIHSLKMLRKGRIALEMCSKVSQLFAKKCEFFLERETRELPAGLLHNFSQ